MQDVSHIKERIKKLKVAKYKCLDSTLFFTRYFFKKRFKRKFVVGDHHEIIADVLDKVFKGEIKRLIINLPPRYSKTELAVKNFIAKGLAINPSAKFIHLTYGDGLAKDNSEEAKDLVLSEEYQEMFTEVQLKHDSKSKNKWYTTKGGGVYATGARGQVTGFGAGKVDEEEEEEQENLEEFLTDIELAQQEFGGAIIVDDPLKPDEAKSDLQRERVNSRFDSTIRNRVNSRKTPIVIIQQRLHPMDLSGYLLEQEPDEWVHINLPALTKQDDGSWKALWPFKHTVEELLQIKKLNEEEFESQYQQSDEMKKGLLYPKSTLKYFDPAKINGKTPEYTVIPVDPADKGGDFYGAPKCDVIEGAVFINKVIFNKRDTDENIPETVELAVHGKAHYVQVESNGGWKLARKSIKKSLEERAPDCEVRSIHARTNKETRIIAAAAWVRNNCYFRNDWEDSDDKEYYDFMKNLTGYLREGSNKNDDAPDVMAQLYEFVQNNLSHLL